MWAIDLHSRVEYRHYIQGFRLVYPRKESMKRLKTTGAVTKSPVDKIHPFCGEAPSEESSGIAARCIND